MLLDSRFYGLFATFTHASAVWSLVWFGGSWRFTSWYCFFAQKDQIEILAFNGPKTFIPCSISSNARMPTHVRRVWLLEIESIWNWDWNIIFRSEVVETECCCAKIFFDNDNVSFNLFVHRGRSHNYFGPNILQRFRKLDCSSITNNISQFSETA